MIPSGAGVCCSVKLKITIIYVIARTSYPALSLTLYSATVTIELFAQQIVNDVLLRQNKTIYILKIIHLSIETEKKNYFTKSD